MGGIVPAIRQTPSQSNRLATIASPDLTRNVRGDSCTPPGLVDELKRDKRFSKSFHHAGVMRGTLENCLKSHRAPDLPTGRTK